MSICWGKVQNGSVPYCWVNLSLVTNCFGFWTFHQWGPTFCLFTSEAQAYTTVISDLEESKLLASADGSEKIEIKVFEIMSFSIIQIQTAKFIIQQI